MSDAIVKYPLEQFRDAIIAAGLPDPGHIETDGEIHRFSTNGKPSDNAGWYVYYSDGIPAGMFGCWRAGIKGAWHADIGRKLTPEEKKAHRDKVEAMRKARQAEELRGHLEAAAEAENLWTKATPATGEHPYLKRKGIDPHGTCIADDGRLLVPMHDTEGKLWNLERIAPEKPTDGGPDKKGLCRGRRTGCFFLFGHIEKGPVLCVCEGFATGASIHEATGLPVAVAFNDGNLKPVAETLRHQWPDLPIVLCADNDLDTEAKGKGNPGVTQAKEAAKATGGLIVAPDFGPDRAEGDTDFNDLHRARGLEAVKQQIERVIAAAGIEQSKPDDPPAPATFPPPEDKRPCFPVLDDWREDDDGQRYRPGVYFCGVQKQRDGSTVLVNDWFCSPLHMDAVTSDKEGNNFGRLLRLKTTFNEWREWAMPMELLGGRGKREELQSTLLSMGMHLSPNQAPRRLPEYLQWRTPKRKVCCVLQTGWAGPGAFVLPDTVIGPDATSITFQSIERGHREYTTGGIPDGWRKEIAARAVGNPLLILALSVGFAGPLLHLIQGESGGLHFFGKSSTGKSSLVEAACSIWGGPNYRAP